MKYSKKKAKELFLKYKTAIGEESLSSDDIIDYTAKQCALIDINNTLEALYSLPDF